jgi:D-3-phosphoglycerate dehydrogenase
VVIAEPIAQPGIDTLAEDCDVDVAIGVDSDELRDRLAGANALIVRSATKVTAELLAAAPQLRVVGRAGVGVDNIDLDAATEAGVMVVNAPDANTISAAEHTMALLLAQARRVTEADASLRRGAWERKRFKGVELHGKTLGIVGLGRIGALVAARATAFGMNVIAFDPFVSEARAGQMGAVLVDLDELYARSDFITVHLPRTSETEGMLDREAFGKMKPGVRLVNVARGGIVDETALAEAITSGQVAGAAIDVFASEPTTSSPLFDLPQVVVTPHLGASTTEAQAKAGTSVAEAVAAALRGEFVSSAVNVDLGPTVADDVKPFLPLSEMLGTVFGVFSRGLPSELEVEVRGKLAEFPVRPIALGALKGALAAVTEDLVSYVNAPVLAASHGVVVKESSSAESEDYQSLVRISGKVAGMYRTVAGTLMARKGPVLVEVDGYEIELPLAKHLLLVRNDDVPGVIGRVGTFLGRCDVNIADMVVGRAPDGRAAMMGLHLDQPLTGENLSDLTRVEGILAARYIDLS